jgi:D-alanyl-lipoteichoic acid acyltransferase DltB (MBOAT superfamily)
MGSAKILGIDLMENFDAPYLSVSVAEFWRKWHISLTSWFKDYLYIPLGGSRKGQMRKYINKMIVFLVSGLWHGANWTFIAWGAYHALLFLPLILLGKNRKYKDVVAQNRILPSLKECGQMLLTFFLVVFGWIIFRAESIGQAWAWMGAICSSSLFSMPGLLTSRILLPIAVFLPVMLAVEWLQREQEHALRPISGKKAPSPVIHCLSKEKSSGTPPCIGAVTGIKNPRQPGLFSNRCIPMDCW